MRYVFTRKLLFAAIGGLGVNVSRILFPVRHGLFFLKVLRVLGQRFPNEVDSAVGKLSRYMAKSKVATAAAAATVLEDGGDDDSDVIEAASREAFKGEALSTLLVSTFVGAELAQHLALQSEVCGVCIQNAVVSRCVGVFNVNGSAFCLP